jgi:hypothetical protein
MVIISVYVNGIFARMLNLILSDDPKNGFQTVRFSGVLNPAKIRFGVTGAGIWDSLCFIHANFGKL